MPRTKQPDLLQNALSATRESRGIDFKSGFDPGANRDWCELLKDIFAFANSGGGVVVVGVDGAGQPINGAADPILSVDPADVGNKIRSYAGSDFDDFEIIARNKSGVKIALLKIGPVAAPLIPTRPGTYEKEPPKQVTAFSVGVVYVRHGAKSEPATTADIVRFIERRVRDQKRAWLAGIRKVTSAPADAVVTVSRPIASPEEAEDVESRPIVPSGDPKATPMRITLDPSAPAAALPDYDKTHPHRMTEFLKALNERLADVGVRITGPSVHTVLEVFGLERDVAYTWKPKYGTRQYTDAFVSWLEGRIRKDRLFIVKARNKLKREGSASVGRR